MTNRVYNKDEEGGNARIDIFGEIGADFWTGENKNTAIRWKDLIEDLKKKKTSCHIRINSLGGSVNDALAMYDMLKSLDNVTTECIGFCASAATIIFMAGRERNIANTARFLIHKCSSYAYGNANDMQRQMEMQRDIDDLITSIYTDAGCEADKVHELMDANDGNGRWIGADQAKEYGFATAVSEGGEVKDGYGWRDFRNAQLPIPDDKKPSIGERIKDLITKIPTNMSKDNTNEFEARNQDLQNQVSQQAATIAQQKNTIDTLTSERDTYRAKAEELQRIIDQMPTENPTVLGNDHPVSNPVADYMHNDPAYQQIIKELNN